MVPGFKRRMDVAVGSCAIWQAEIADGFGIITTLSGPRSPMITAPSWADSLPLLLSDFMRDGHRNVRRGHFNHYPPFDRSRISRITGAAKLTTSQGRRLVVRTGEE